jgi:hypothetical protein
MIRYDYELELVFVNEVPFTRECLARIKNVIKKGNAIPDEQFKFAVTVVCTNTNNVVMIDELLLNEIETFLKYNKHKLAHEVDFDYTSSSYTS